MGESDFGGVACGGEIDLHVGLRLAGALPGECEAFAAREGCKGAACCVAVVPREVDATTSAGIDLGRVAEPFS